MGRRVRRYATLCCAWVALHGLSGEALSAVITRLPATQSAHKQIALTFDACQTVTPARLDHKISDFLLAQKIPFTLFVSGRFAQGNREALHELAQNPLVEIENHSLNHRQHMERLSTRQLQIEVQDNTRLLQEITGRTPRYFRFPAGNYDARSLAQVEQMGYPVVHWSFASGDPDPHISTRHLIQGVLKQNRPGSILIFHINRRGWHTGEALPEIVAQLRTEGYHFVSLSEALTGMPQPLASAARPSRMLALSSPPSTTVFPPTQTRPPPGTDAVPSEKENADDDDEMENWIPITPANL